MEDASRRFQTNSTRWLEDAIRNPTVLLLLPLSLLAPTSSATSFRSLKNASTTLWLAWLYVRHIWILKRETLIYLERQNRHCTLTRPGFGECSGSILAYSFCRLPRKCWIRDSWTQQPIHQENHAAEFKVVYYTNTAGKRMMGPPMRWILYDMFISPPTLQSFQHQLLTSLHTIRLLYIFCGIPSFQMIAR